MKRLERQYGGLLSPRLWVDVLFPRIPGLRGYWQRKVDREIAEHEAQCTRCGKCCRWSVQDPADSTKSIYTDKWCKFWDKKARECTVYEIRSAMALWCSPHQKAMARRHYPNDCPYVQDIEGYECSIREPDWKKIPLKRRVRLARKRRLEDGTECEQVGDVLYVREHGTGALRKVATIRPDGVVIGETKL